METVTIALGVSILVVFVLLMSCWKSKPKKSGCGKNNSPVYQDLQPMKDLSSYGTGVQNRRAAQRQRDLSGLKGYDDYNQVAQYASLEPEVFESHEEYSKDINRSTSGASMGSVRSDDITGTPWVARRPQYQDVPIYGVMAQEHSTYKDQLPDNNHYLL